jgi:2-oxoglutarate ferredoxin oxidoreductase subunit delta
MANGLVRIDEDRCKSCELCVPVCPPQILKIPTGRYNAKGYPPIEVTNMDACTGCALCAIICPDVVFTVYREKRKPKRATASA